MVDQIWAFITENQCGAVGAGCFLAGVVLQKYVDVLAFAKAVVFGKPGATKDFIDRLEAVEDAVEKALADRDAKKST